MPLVSPLAIRRTLLNAVWLLGVVLAVAPSAAAQGLAPQVDRDAPASVEYQLPVNQAREQAAGAGAQSAGAANAPPLFGVGVKKPTSRGPDAKGVAGTGNRSRQPPLSGDAPAVVRAHAPQPDDAVGGLMLAATGGAAVLVIGGLAGLAWRRRRRVRDG